jgi:hypothetical protein
LGSCVSAVLLGKGQVSGYFGVPSIRREHGTAPFAVRETRCFGASTLSN